MSRLYLLDPSLRGSAGHHLQYARLVMQAAENRRLECLLGTHVDFDKHAMDGPLGRVLNIYKHSIYDDPLMAPGAGCATPLHRLSATLSDWASCLIVARRRRRRRAMVAQFCQATVELFRAAPLQYGDHVYLPAGSELLMLGLGEALASIPNSDRATWHLLFHFDYLLGRPAKWTRQKQRIRRMRRTLKYLRNALPKQRLHCYTTTEHLSNQYELLNQGPFHALPYPVDPSLPVGDKRQQTSSPLRITVAGDARIDKGFQHLPEIIRPLSEDLVSSGKIRFDLQANFSFRLPCRRRNMPLVHSRHELQAILGDDTKLRFDPLSSDDYRQLIRDADIGLLPYRAEHYYSRCSGVVVEMLGAAVPIIVPAGCWMSDQISAAIARHQRTMREALSTVDSLTLGQVFCSRRLQTPDAIRGDELTFSTNRGAALWQLTPPVDATHLAIEFRPSKSTPVGTSIRIECDSVNATADPSKQDATIVSAIAGRPAIAMLRVDSSVQGLRLRWENAFDCQRISVKDVRFDFLSAKQLDGGDYPLGAVGVIADGPTAMTRAVREIVRFYPHYRETAREFSREWNAAHHPDRVIEKLLTHASDETRVDDRHPPEHSRRRALPMRNPARAVMQKFEYE